MLFSQGSQMAHNPTQQEIKNTYLKINYFSIEIGGLCQSQNPSNYSWKCPKAIYAMCKGEVHIITHYKILWKDKKPYHITY